MIVELAAIGAGVAKAGLYDSSNVFTSSSSAVSKGVEAFEMNAAAGASWTSPAPAGSEEKWAQACVGGTAGGTAGGTVSKISLGAEKSTVQVVTLVANVFLTVKSVRFSTSDRAFLNSSCSTTIFSLLAGKLVSRNGTSPLPTIIVPDLAVTANVHFSWTGSRAVGAGWAGAGGAGDGGGGTGVAVTAGANVTPTPEKFASIGFELAE